ncbi:ABC transporter substrate-binding protein [Pigmentiphaga litoralis]|nr:ABC transporter substrate-binding protein [Pigmentiphaga litoralis]
MPTRSVYRALRVERREALIIGRGVKGLTPDRKGRSLAKELAVAWGQSVIFENRPGANTIISSQAVATAEPDGHTLLFAIDATITTNPHLYKKLPYDPVADFAPVTMLTTFGTLLVANSSVKPDTLADLIATDKASPSSISYASIGLGSQMHLDSEMLKYRTGTRFMHVPYKGIPQMTQSILQNETQLGWLGVFTAKPLLESGRLKAYAYGGKKRSLMLPNVPTFSELGYPDVGVNVWYGLLAPAKTPRAVVERINTDVRAVLADSAFVAANMEPKGYEPVGMSPEAFARHIRDELATRKTWVKVAGVEAE